MRKRVTASVRWIEKRFLGVPVSWPDYRQIEFSDGCRLEMDASAKSIRIVWLELGQQPEVTLEGDGDSFFDFTGKVEWLGFVVEVSESIWSDDRISVKSGGREIPLPPHRIVDAPARRDELGIEFDGDEEGQVPIPIQKMIIGLKLARLSHASGPST